VYTGLEAAQEMDVISPRDGHVTSISGSFPRKSSGLVAVSVDKDSAKAHAAQAGAGLVQDGMTVGLGSGSTAALMVQHLAARMRQEGLRIIGVPTSGATAELASGLEIPLRDLDEVWALDINIDGADEVDAQFRMIKGRGGALLREKIVASTSRRRVTMITPEKRVSRLGIVSPIPVEVSTFGLKHIERRLKDLGATTFLRRRGDGSLALTDGGNAIIDCKFPPVADPVSLDAQLQCVPGVFETGLFIDLCDTLIVGSSEGVDVIQSGAPKQP
jgi:ribose 5-phosphate isomerase A